ncbi:trk system potassium uptake protein TrkA [Spinactinospora alkalitolerans]|uniref:Trk system potassium uptake protein TrkA n=2 Tax=Spinactinospora alkalitolerans TaxID=687207 RepID=A0A852TQT1_9ACTN|nr:trk system potassium uptake protein TrkA [Spinactinospora alkalitolerans]
MGHTVAVIDREPEAFRRLRSSSAKCAVAGLGHDREVLIRAGIESATAFAAVSSGDNSNIIAARVARESFGVRHVVARIYDPRRAQVYQRLGIPTVGTVRWTADTILRRLVPGGGARNGGDGTAPDALWHDPSGSLVMTEAVLDGAWADLRVEQLEAALPLRVAYLSRAGEIVLPRGDSPLLAGDVVHVLAQAADIGRVEERLRGSGGAVGGAAGGGAGEGGNR